MPPAGPLDVDWTAPTQSGLTGYSVHWQAAGGEFHTATGEQSEPATATTAAIDGLVAGVAYQVRVEAHYPSNVSASAAAVSGTPVRQLAALAAPSATTIAADPAGRAAAAANPSDPVGVTVAWTAPAADAAAPVLFTELQWRPDTATAHSTDDRARIDGGSPRTVEGFALGATYDFRLRAWNLDGAGAWSDVTGRLVAHTPDAPALASVDAGAAAGLDSGQVRARWQAPAFNGGSDLTAHELQWTTTAPSPQFTPHGTETVAAADTAHTIDNLADGATHWVRVRALNAAGAGAWSNTRAAVPSTTPGAPAITLTHGDKGITAQWDPPDDGGKAVTGYELRYRTSDTGTGAGTWQTRTRTSTATTAAVTGLVNGQQYDVEVAATNPNGTGNWSNTATAVPSTTPDASTNVALTPGAGRITVSWDAPVGDGGNTITGYELRYRTSSAGQWQAWTHTSTATTAVITPLVNGQAYDIDVAAVNVNGPGARSAARTATAGRPGPVRNVEVTARNGELRLSWDPPANAAEFPDTDEAHIKYRVQWREGSSTNLDSSNTIWLLHGQEFVPRIANSFRVSYAGQRYGAFDSTGGFPGVTDFSALSNGSVYTVGMSAAFATADAVTAEDASLLVLGDDTYTSGTPSTVSVPADSPLYARLRTVGDRIVSDHGSGWAWLRSTWQSVKDGTTVSLEIADLEGYVFGQVDPRCHPEAIFAAMDSLGDCGRGVVLTIDLDAVGYTDTDGTPAQILANAVIHEMAHIFSFSSTLPDPGWPWGLAWLYFWETSDQRTPSAGYELVCAAELLADTMTTLAATDYEDPSYYQAFCVEEPLSEEARDEMADVATKAAAGQESGWFVENYRAGGAATGAVDRAAVWASVKQAPVWTPGQGALSRHVIVLMLQDLFGGYCSARAATDTFEEHPVVVDPWNDGGCGPGAPTGVTAAAATTAGELLVSWTAPTSSGGAPVTGYKVQWKSGTDDYDASRQKVLTSQPAATSTTISGLAPGVAHTVRVLAVNTIGDGDASVDATATPLAAPPGAPGALTLTAGNAELTVSWGLPQPAGSPAAATYEIQWKGPGEAYDESETSVRRVLLQSPTSLSHTIDGLTNGDTYTVRVRAANTAGAGPWSDEASSSPGVPGPVGSLAAEAWTDRIIVTWDPPTQTGGEFLTDSAGNPDLVYRITWQREDSTQTCVSLDAVYNTVYVVSNARSFAWCSTAVAEDKQISIKVEAANVTAAARCTSNCPVAGYGAESTVLATPATGSADSARRNATLKRIIEARVVQRYESAFPWLRKTWDHLRNRNQGNDVQVTDLTGNLQAQVTNDRCPAVPSIKPGGGGASEVLVRPGGGRPGVSRQRDHCRA